MEANWKDRGDTLTVFNLGIILARFMLRPLYREPLDGKITPIRTGCSHRRSGRGDEQKKFLFLTGIKTL